MFTVFASPRHVLPEQIEMPTLRDDLGGGAVALKRQHTRALRRWELESPGRHGGLDPLIGLLEYVQGDNAFWFDGAGMIEVSDPILVGIGNGTQTDFSLLHRHVYVASAIIYLNGAATADFTPLGDGITMDSIRFTSAPAANVQITAIYRRKAKVVLQADQNGLSRERIMRFDDNEQTVERVRYFLQEVPF